MNIIISKLENIKSLDNLNLLYFEEIKVLILQMNLNIKIGKKAKLYIKPTKLFLSKEKCEFENRLKVNINNIKKGDILASILCEYKNFKLEVIMLKECINFENEAYLYFKASDISIVEVIDD